MPGSNTGSLCSHSSMVIGLTSAEVYQDNYATKMPQGNNVYSLIQSPGEQNGADHMYHRGSSPCLMEKIAKENTHA